MPRTAAYYPYRRFIMNNSRKPYLSTIVAIAVMAILFLGLTAAVAQDAKKPVGFKVRATPIPHGDLLRLVKDDLLALGIRLEIIELTDYVTPNLLLAEKQLDANFFQHTPYLVNFAAERKLSLEPAGAVFVAPLALYSRKYKKLSDIPSGSVIAIPNDPTNEARALILFQNKGLIKLAEGSGLKATIRDIVENSKKFVFKEIEAPQLPRTLDDTAASVINGSFASQAGFVPARDNLIIEGAESPYANIVAVRKGDAGDWRVIALVKALQTDKVKDYLNKNYNGSFVPAF
jgi:D-methionine transport system substrate-binding protein